MADRPKYVPDDQREHLGDPPWKSGPELDAWEQAHGHDVRTKCYVEYGCLALDAHYEWLLGEVDRLRAEIEGERIYGWPDPQWPTPESPTLWVADGLSEDDGDEVTGWPTEPWEDA